MDRLSKSKNGMVSRAELGHFLESFRRYILGNLSEQIDMLLMQNKQKVENVVSLIFCPRCRKKHPLRECLLDKIEICVIYEKRHATKDFPSLPGCK